MLIGVDVLSHILYRLLFIYVGLRSGAGVRFTGLPMMTLKINVIIKMATSTEIDILYRAVLDIKEIGV